MSGTVFLNSQGSFDVRLGGFMQLGSNSFGIRGDFNIHVSSQFYSNGSGGCARSDGCYALLLEGSASVRVRVFGITLVGFGIGFSFGFDTRTMPADGRVKVELSVTVSIDLGLFSISKTAHFTIGYLQFPPATYLGGDQSSASTWSGGALYLNVGDRKGSRGIGPDDANESYVIDQTGTSGSGATIVVTAFGRTNTYTNVTSIHGDFGDGEDTLVVHDSVAVPVFVTGTSGDKTFTYSGSGVGSTITGGTGNDIIAVDGSGRATVHGGDGNDVIVHSGTGAVTMYGDRGDDSLVGSSAGDVLYGGDGNDRLGGPAAEYHGDGNSTDYVSSTPGNDVISVVLDGAQTPVIDGGGNSNDVLDATLSGGADTLVLSTTGAGNLRLQLNGVLRTASNIELLTVHSGTGSDALTVGDLVASGIQEVTIDLGPGSPDSVTVVGSTSGDTFSISGDNRTGHPAPEVKVARTGTYSVWVDHAVRAEGDTLTVDGADGNDTIDASAIAVDTVALRLLGGLGNDTLIGSPFADVLDGGHDGVIVGADGNDTMTGGLGADTFFDGGGSDTLVETVSGDIALDNNLFVVGALSGATDFLAGAVAENLKGIFETARVTGTSGAHTYLVGDADGTVAIGGSSRSAQAWAGDATLGLAAGDNTVRVELNGARGARRARRRLGQHRRRPGMGHEPARGPPRRHLRHPGARPGPADLGGLRPQLDPDRPRDRRLCVDRQRAAADARRR